jgi:AbrB family looped-hinge helix DNA binding protein
MNIGTTIGYQPNENFELHSKITRKGQITIPSDVRNLLGLKKGDKIAFMVNKNRKVEIIKKSNVVLQTAGIVKSKLTPFTAKQLRKEAELAIANDSNQRSL